MSISFVDFYSLRTIFNFVRQAEIAGLEIEDLEIFLKSFQKMKRLVAFIKADAPDFQIILPDINWQKAYEKLNMAEEYTQIVRQIPSLPKNPNFWIVPVAQGISCNKIISILKNYGIKIQTPYEDLDRSISHDRNPDKGSYFVGFLRVAEADEDNKDKSANMLLTENQIGITLLERLLLGFGYFITVYKHLDSASITLCNGSRDNYGFIPKVYWHSFEKKFCIGLYKPNEHDSYVRSRSVIFILNN